MTIAMHKICKKKASHGAYAGPTCHRCDAEATPVTEETRKFSISDPGQSLRQEMGDIKWRLNLLRSYEERTTEIFKAARHHLPFHLHVLASVSPRIHRQIWRKPPTVEPRFQVEIDCKEAESWDDLSGFLEALDEIGYNINLWKSEDQANYGYRRYTWATKDGEFEIIVKLYPKEVDEVDEQGVPVVKCKKVLLGKKFHRGYDHTEDVYAFDCGQGEEELRQEAIKAGRL